MSKYTRDPTAEEFLDWVDKNPDYWRVFYQDYILDDILQAESDDFFGTEGFDKRYG